MRLASNASWHRKPDDTMVKENDIQKSILEALWYNKIKAWRNNTGAYRTEHGGFVRFGTKGSGDIFAIQPKTGRFISIEVKTQKKYPTPDQKQWMQEVNDAGGIAFVARSIDDLRTNGII